MMRSLRANRTNPPIPISQPSIISALSISPTVTRVSSPDKRGVKEALVDQSQTEVVHFRSSPP